MRKNIYAILCGLVLPAAVVLFVGKGCAKAPLAKQEPGEPVRRLCSPLVVSYHDAGREAGYKILNSGGNAFDAYVAVTMVENVVSAGYVTPAGLLSTLIYRGETGEFLYLDGGYNTVSDPQGIYDPKTPAVGNTVAVPGLVAGLAAVSKRFGRLSFAEVLQPAIKIAKEGFVLHERDAAYIEQAAKKLQGTEYGRRTFFPRGKMLCAGDTLELPELAEFLSKLAEQGAAYMYSGQWAEKCVELVCREGGRMTLNDLSTYRPTWHQPWRISYRGYDIYASSGRSMLALWTLLALKTLEHTNLDQANHYSSSAADLEILVRVARAVDQEAWIRDYRNIDNRELVDSRLTSTYTEGIWDKVQQKTVEDRQPAPPAFHTLSTIVADKEGNVITGNHSINADLWGNGLFVQGVLLNGSADMAGRFTGLGKRRTQGAGNFLVFKDGVLRYACGTFSFSNPHAAFQFLVNVLDYGLPPEQAVELPRFGSFPFDQETWTVDVTRNWLDEHVSPDIIETLKRRGLYFSLEKPLLGKGCIAEFFPDGRTAAGYDKDNH